MTSLEDRLRTLREARKPAPDDDVPQRLANLRRLRELLQRREPEILEALALDLGKSAREAYLSEVLMVQRELSYLLAHTARFARGKRRLASLLNFPSINFQYNEPYGVVLVVAPWNYPYHLSLLPLIGALAAGNRVVLKPSGQAKHTAGLLADLIAEALPAEVACVLTGPDANRLAMEEVYDFIFFTGGEEMGRKFYEKAARDFCPIVLELGGKSPCLLLEDADLDLSVRRIAFGKYLNAGQTCVSVDHVYCPRSLLPAFLEKMEQQIAAFYHGDLESPELGNIINRVEFARLQNLLAAEEEFRASRSLQGHFSPRMDEGSRKIYPLVFESLEESPLMQRELFGPVLPVIAYDELEPLLQGIQKKKVPLAFYVFTRNRRLGRAILRRMSFGGGALNDTVQHLVGEVPFGGFKDSGLGAYHGKQSYFTFVHEKSILQKSLLIDLRVRYPGEKFAWVQKFFG